MSLPPLDSFRPSTMDVLTNAGLFPPGGSPRQSGVNVLLAGAFDQGTLNRIAAAFGYTHVILADPAIEIRDAYTGNTGTPSTTPDILALPAGQTNNFWFAVFAMLAVFPTLGKRRLIFADRHGTPGDWTTAT